MAIKYMHDKFSKELKHSHNKETLLHNNLLPLADNNPHTLLW